MTLKDKLDIAVMVATLLGFAYGATVGGTKLAQFWLRRRTERREGRVVVELRRFRRERGHSGLMVTAEPGGDDYVMFERMVSSGKLHRAPFPDGYCLPEDAPRDRYW